MTLAEHRSTEKKPFLVPNGTKFKDSEELQSSNISVLTLA
jgi:hypothetical protein